MSTVIYCKYKSIHDNQNLHAVLQIIQLVLDLHTRMQIIKTVRENINKLQMYTVV